MKVTYMKGNVVLFTSHDTYSIPRAEEYVYLDKQEFVVSNVVNYPKAGFVEIFLMTLDEYKLATSISKPIKF